MRKVLLIAVLFTALIGCNEENEVEKNNFTKEQRNGLDDKLVTDVLEVADTINELYVDLDIAYDELDVESEAFNIINGFEYDKYKNDDEEYSPKEDYLINQTLLLISDYMLHESVTEEGTIRERGDDMMEKVDHIYKSTSEEGFYPY
ncbi:MULTISPECIES: hypothetical protein [unclassified Virgibacillus]|uniref:hypothetical protein n=1 Tax=unclassified Virgibacillus TaxID=2620237 RepID=UPI00090AD299|nr:MULTISPECIES: hypothetical protein [unclassified Virgibacillus]API92704.1 hypothetical protein BKP57_13350 [Virgibacillus sp. 6R]MBS7428200.1 hypothetical protein [Virgibacillus sp. 19R1-5]